MLTGRQAGRQASRQASKQARMVQASKEARSVTISVEYICGVSTRRRWDCVHVSMWSGSALHTNSAMQPKAAKGQRTGLKGIDEW